MAENENQIQEILERMRPAPQVQTNRLERDRRKLEGRKTR